MRSIERILTTHTGSLPKPDDLVELIWQKAEHEPVDEAVLAERIATEVNAVVDLQRNAGIDIVNDGEVSKPGFSNYIYARYSGFHQPVDVFTPLTSVVLTS